MTSASVSLVVGLQSSSSILLTSFTTAAVGGGMIKVFEEEGGRTRNDIVGSLTTFYFQRQLNTN